MAPLSLAIIMKKTSLIQQNGIVYCYKIDIPNIDWKPIVSKVKASQLTKAPRATKAAIKEVSFFTHGTSEIRKLRKRKFHRKDDLRRQESFLTREFESWIMDLRLQGLVLSRLRILLFPPGKRLNFHIDEHSENASFYRLMICLNASSQLILQWKTPQELILTKGFSDHNEPILLNVSQPHRVNNLGDKWEFMFLASVLNTDRLNLKG